MAAALLSTGPSLRASCSDPTPDDVTGTCLGSSTVERSDKKEKIRVRISALAHALDSIEVYYTVQPRNPGSNPGRVLYMML